MSHLHLACVHFVRHQNISKQIRTFPMNLKTQSCERQDLLVFRSRFGNRPWMDVFEKGHELPSLPLIRFGAQSLYSLTCTFDRSRPSRPMVEANCPFLASAIGSNQLIPSLSALGNDVAAAIHSQHRGLDWKSCLVSESITYRVRLAGD